MTFKYLGMHLF